MAKIKRGEVVSGLRLKRNYGPYALPVLLQVMVIKYKGDQFKVVAEPPTHEVWRKMLHQYFTVPVVSLIDDGYSTFNDLGQQLQDWHDNLPENLQQGGKGCALEDGAGTLTGFSMPDLDCVPEDLTTVWYPDTKVRSRVAQCAEACGKLRTAAEALREQAAVVAAHGDTGADDRGVEDLQSLADEIEQAADEAEGVEFPGMYG